MTLIFIDMERSSRRQIVAAIHAMIDRLDSLDGDCDLEPDADSEPSLGWSSTYAIGRYDGDPRADEREEAQLEEVSHF